jgi:outer membrane protein insertion porin family
VQTLPGQNAFGPSFPPFSPPSNFGPPSVDELGPLPPTVDFDVFVEETRTGRFMFGAGVNSDLGLTGQIVVDERNFDWRRPPTSFQDVLNGTAWRGAGQGFRLEAMPGSQVQRYLGSFTEPYLFLPGFADPFSLSLSGFFYDRRFFDWDEQRLGGRAALGYRLTHDLSITTALRAENVNIHRPRVLDVPELNAVLGESDLFSGRVAATHDTRDTAFAATEGHLFELSYEQVFGSFDYPRGEVDYRQYFLVRERPDGSGRHTLSYSFRAGFSGGQTPIFENYFAGGYSTLRGFDFRGASPIKSANVAVGGEFRFLGSIEYMFPLTADDMIKGVVFCDYGTVEEKIELHSDSFRVAPGVGLRIAIPALGPAPLALDLAFPVAHAPFDDIQNFSFFFGFGRN